MCPSAPLPRLRRPGMERVPRARQGPQWAPAPRWGRAPLAQPELRWGLVRRPRGPRLQRATTPWIAKSSFSSLAPCLWGEYWNEPAVGEWKAVSLATHLLGSNGDDSLLSRSGEWASMKELSFQSIAEL